MTRSRCGSSSRSRIRRRARPKRTGPGSFCSSLHATILVAAREHAMARLILGIETSCDETGAAVVTDAGDVLSDVVHSQVPVHAPYGGVVPELASRDHVRNVKPVVMAALERAGTELSKIDGIAVTCRPGLSGALLVG